MMILQVSSTDLTGRRFNGRDLQILLSERGIRSQHCVWDKQSDNPDTWQLFNFRGRRHLKALVNRIESILSIQSVLQPFSLQFLVDGRFHAADVVHYHLIHTGYFSLLSLPLLSRVKRTVWTLHDPWAMTGHCVYPFDCERWKIGCGQCPYLDTVFPMRRDHTALMYRLKKAAYHASKVDIVLGSHWMMDMAKQSPLLSKFRLHHIPFGIDLQKFRPNDSEKAKRELGIHPGSFVICFRAGDSQFKGLTYIKTVLQQLELNQNICLLTFDGKGEMNEFIGKYQIIDLGWVNDVDLAVQAYNAADIFLMPSTAEAFGMMAIEAMACGKPVIAFDDTSLPEVIFNPEGGISVPMGDTTALLSALERLRDHPDEREKLGLRARVLAEHHYDIKHHVDKLVALYQDIASNEVA